MKDLGSDVREAAVEHTKKNSAREIIKRIAHWQYAQPDVAKRRWIFELLQNAIDSATEGNNDLKIEVKQFKKDERTYLRFKHNGGPFSHEELCAIIYGGTTKLEAFTSGARPIGRFGSGLLVTHILNKKVKIKGVGKEKDGTKHIFELSIDRTSDNEKDIMQDIDKCFDQLTRSPVAEDAQIATVTEYTYELEVNLGKEAAQAGIAELEKLMPWILSFNSKLVEIDLDGKTFTTETDDISKELARVSVLVAGKKCDEEVLLSTKGETVAGVLVQTNKVMGINKETPRLFISMPLIGSEIVSIPFIINSVLMEPSEERDVLLLADETDEDDNEENTKVKQNKETIEQALNCYYTLLSYCIESGYQALYQLCAFQKISDECLSLKGEFARYWQEVIKRIVDGLQEFNIIDSSKGKKKPTDTVFLSPIISEITNLSNQQLLEFYDIVCNLKSTFPSKEIVSDWTNVAESWKDIDKNLQLKFYDVLSLKNEIKDASQVGKKFQTFSTVAKTLNIEDIAFKKLLEDFSKLTEALLCFSKPVL